MAMFKLARIVLILLISLFSVGASAQTHYQPNISIGVKGGIDFTQMFFNPSVKQGFLLGGVAGLSFRYMEEKHFGVIAELNFEQRGWQENFEEYPFSYKRTLNYIQIPVLAHIYFGNEKARFFVNAGPEIGFLIGESTSTNFDVNNIASLDFPPNRQTSQYFMKAQNKVDYGISGGLGAEIFINKKNSFSLEGRFYYGLGNVFKSDRIEPFNASNSMSIMVTLGYWFRLK